MGVDSNYRIVEKYRRNRELVDRIDCIGVRVRTGDRLEILVKNQIPVL